MAEITYREDLLQSENLRTACIAPPTPVMCNIPTVIVKERATYYPFKFLYSCQNDILENIYIYCNGRAANC